jgi:AcrR family transcriptional regulator
VTSYHHGNLRAALVEAAVERGREQGPDGIVLREVARRVGVSHNAAYRHFADRQTLLAEVASLALTGLAETMQERMSAARGADAAERALARLRAAGAGYVEYALTEPGLFAVAFRAFAFRDASVPAQPSPGPFELLSQALDECVAGGALDPRRRPGAETTCWSAVHGFAELHLNGPLRHVPKRQRDADLEGMLERIERGLG